MKLISAPRILLALSMIFAPLTGLKAQSSYTGYAIPAEGAAYADIADLVTKSTMIVDVRVRKIQKLSVEQSAAVPANVQRAVITADVLSLIRGDKSVAARVRFLLDIPRDERGKIPKLKKKRYFVMGAPVSGRPDMIRLSRPDALISFSERNAAMVRDITREHVQLDAPSAVAGIASAFYSPGTIIGEGTTQIFLQTADNRPFSISIISRPGKPKKWTVSTSELIEESAATPKRFTLMWYRLACGLPRALSPDLVESGGSENAARAQADYRHVINVLGPCGRKAG